MPLTPDYRITMVDWLPFFNGSLKMHGRKLCSYLFPIRQQTTWIQITFNYVPNLMKTYPLHIHLFLLGCLMSCTISYAQQKNVSDFSTGFKQSINVESYRGKKFRLKAAVKVLHGDNKSLAQLWAMVENSIGMLSFSDDMSERPISTPKWKVYSIEGNIDKDATNLLFGGRVNGNGQFFFDDFKLSIQSGDGKWQTISIRNPGFEESFHSSGLPNGWIGRVAFVKKFSGTLTSDAYSGKKAYLIEGKGITGKENKVVQVFAMFSSKANVELHAGKKFRLQVDFKAIGKENLSALGCFVRVDRQRGKLDGFFSNSEGCSPSEFRSKNNRAT